MKVCRRTYRCVVCGAEFQAYRKTCSAECAKIRIRDGGKMGGRIRNNLAGYWTPRNVGDGRSVMTARGLEVLDPVALAAAGVAMRDCYGREWVPL